MDLMKLEKLKKEILPYINDGVWQAILDVCYDKWQNNIVKSYEEMLSWANEEFGEIAEFAIMIGKFNQQICNGGINQYVDNGFAGDAGDIHDNMLYYFETFGLLDSLFVKKVYTIIKDMVVVPESRYGDACPDCNGDGYEYWDRDEEHECSYCGGSGYDPDAGMLPDQDDLEKEYYKYNEKFEQYMERWFEDKVMPKPIALVAKEFSNVR